MPIPKLTKEQAAIIGLYTGVSCGPFADIQLLGDRVAGRPTWTHEYGDKAFWAELKEGIKPEFLALCYDEATAGPEGGSDGPVEESE